MSTDDRVAALKAAKEVLRTGSPFSPATILVEDLIAVADYIIDGTKPSTPVDDTVDDEPDVFIPDPNDPAWGNTSDERFEPAGPVAEFSADWTGWPAVRIHQPDGVSHQMGRFVLSGHAVWIHFKCCADGITTKNFNRMWEWVNQDGNTVSDPREAPKT